MELEKLLEFMAVAEKLKCNTRHSWTSDGRRESVAEHTCRLCMFAWLVKDEIPGIDISRVLEMSLFHDIGEAVTGDIPAFEKSDEDREVESAAWEQICSLLPGSQKQELVSLLKELEDNVTPEARLVHALDKMEALIQHNEADISTWLPLEYDLQMTYGNAEAQTFSFTRKLRKKIQEDSVEKIKREKGQ